MPLRSSLKDKIAIVTGATSGIGKAIALSLIREGAVTCPVGRNADSLQDVLTHAQKSNQCAKSYQIDLTIDEDVERLSRNLEKDFGNIDILIHSAGVISMDTLECASIEDLDQQYRINVRAPYMLTKLLLPMIKSRQGQIVFINSNVGLKARANIGQYAATKHALRAIADSLREEVYFEGIRVLSIYPGRTATPMQALVHKMEEKIYDPSKFIQPEDVAAVVTNTLALPQTVEVTDINMSPREEDLV